MIVHPTPVRNHHMPARRPKKRRDDRRDSDKDETSSKLNKIVGVMKDSANHLVAHSQTVAHDPREKERVSFFQWMLEFTEVSRTVATTDVSGTVATTEVSGTVAVDGKKRNDVKATVRNLKYLVILIFL